jgi:cold shock CspA family protein
MVRQVGRVKWFNNKSGYGFLEVENSPDMFVHHKNLVVTESQYRYLVQGEYVEFELQVMDNNKTTAADVTGIRRGPLMCETRHLAKMTQEGGMNGVMSLSAST